MNPMSQYPLLEISVLTFGLSGLLLQNYSCAQIQVLCPSGFRFNLGDVLCKSAYDFSRKGETS